MTALPPQGLRDFVGALLADSAILKLGFGLPGDLWAVAKRLGGLAAVRHAAPVVDLKAAHAALARRRRLPKVATPRHCGSRPALTLPHVPPSSCSITVQQWMSRHTTPAQGAAQIFCIARADLLVLVLSLAAAAAVVVVVVVVWSHPFTLL